VLRVRPAGVIGIFFAVPLSAIVRYSVARKIA
jgi:hypothetical protein